MEVDYYAKYLKYKNKYIQLKEQIGGVVIDGIKCNKHGHFFCSNLAIGCHWNKDTLNNNTQKKGLCVKNECSQYDKKHCPLGCHWNKDTINTKTNQLGSCVKNTFQKPRYSRKGLFKR